MVSKQRIVIAVAAIVLVIAVAIGVVLGGALSSFGLSSGQALQVYRMQLSDAAAIRDAEGPIQTPNGIAESGFVRIGGIEQWVTIRGEDRGNPAILLVHGGPGNAVSQLAYFFRGWEKEFTIVQWDQRGAGRTYGRYGDATPSFTLDTMITDGLEVADHARRHLGREKLILIGHSFGSALAVNMLKRDPRSFSAFVGTGQLVRAPDVAAAEYAFILSRLIADRKLSAAARLQEVGPPPYNSAERGGEMQQWLNRYLVEPDQVYFLSAIGVMLRNANYSLKDFQNFQMGVVRFSIPRLYSEVNAIDLNSLGYEMPIPFFVIDGLEDHIAPATLVADYFDKVHAPKKAMILINDAGHFAMMTHANDFLRILREQVLVATALETDSESAARD
jgi:pimeloyl-ACP methyl ester carboxylesterase